MKTKVFLVAMSAEFEVLAHELDPASGYPYLRRLAIRKLAEEYSGLSTEELFDALIYSVEPEGK